MPAVLLVATGRLPGHTDKHAATHFYWPIKEGLRLSKCYHHHYRYYYHYYHF